MFYCLYIRNPLNEDDDKNLVWHEFTDYKKCFQVARYLRAYAPELDYLIHFEDDDDWKD